MTDREEARPGTRWNGIKRRTPLPRSTKPIPRSPIKKRRTVKRFATLRDPSYCRWIRGRPCPFNRAKMRFEPPEAEIRWMLFHKDCSGPIECAHVKTRACGGADRGNAIPLCRTHHRQQHDMGIKGFQDLYGLDMVAFATRLEHWYVDRVEEAF